MQQRKSTAFRIEVVLVANDDRRLVYSTDQPYTPLEPKARKPEAAARVPDDGTVRVARERRRGGIVTLITGLGHAEIVTVAKGLKRTIGTGGTVKDGVVELQGEHRDAVVAYLEREGRRVKRAGG